MKLFLIILASLVLEVFVWIGVGDLVGSMWYVFFWFIVMVLHWREHCTEIISRPDAANAKRCRRAK